MKKLFNGSELNQKMIFDHPSGLFVLFFTEMWERFSYYGMRAILVLFLTSSIMNEGWGWERADALELYALYTGLVYLTPLIGGILADKYFGYRNATVLGALIMALGHGSMALEFFSDSFFFLGIALLIIGNGLFKPNISSIVGQLYKDDDIRKDGGYTIFYMGINCGAFLGILLCGYLGENIGWHWGFGLAGIFMFFGMLQFYFAQGIFGEIGLKPKVKKETFFNIIINSIKGLWNSLIYGINNTPKIVYVVLGLLSLAWTVFDGSLIGYLFITGLLLIIFFGIAFKRNLTKIEWDRISVILVFSAATIFFWWAFEQAGGSMTIFAGDYTERNLTGDSAAIFKIVNTIITIVPMIVITYVLLRLFQNIFQKYFLSNFFLAMSFIIIWGIVIWMINNEFTQESTEIPASWFSVLNSLFIIIFAPIFSKIWASRYNPSGPIKFSIGLILLGLGFAFLSYGSMSIPFGAKTASVSIFWLVFAYLFHTLGELCVSPVGLSYVSKLAPVRLIGLMFGFWLLSSAIANSLGGITGSYIDKISESYGLSGFFLIFTFIPIGAGIIMFLLNGFLKKRMHGYN
jgi:POT family proton-dependent oligopeptide transporter